MQGTPDIQGRVWRHGNPQEDFTFDDISGYLREPDTLVWVDLCAPDHDALCGLAAELGRNTWAVEDELFDGTPRQAGLQRRTFQLRRDLVALRRVALPMREVVNSIQHHRHEVGTVPELDPLYADLYDHVLRVSEWTESLRDMVTTIFETNLSLQDARLNTIMKKLTGWAAIIAVPTAITGFYGQNVPYPGSGHVAGFLASTCLIFVLMAVIYVMFKRRDWL